MTIREATRSDADVFREIAGRSLRSSYEFLDQETIDTAVDQWYSEERAAELLEEDDWLVYVAEEDDEVVGYIQARLVPGPDRVGVIHWLHVDPDYRSRGIGTDLFEHVTGEFEDRDVDRIEGVVLAGNEEGATFYDTHGFELARTRTVEIGDDTHVEHVYADDAGAADRREVEAFETPDGETVYVAYDEADVGSEGLFHVAYLSPDHEERYGWFCANCETVDVAMSTMGRLVCNECGNARKATRWDAAYL